MSLSFTTEYFPDLDDLTPEEVAAARERVVADLQAVLPDVDFAPGTPSGDMIATALADYRVAAEVSFSRLMSDLDLGNVAGGLIYSCAFVQAYLGNFGVYDVENLRASGLVRLTFSSAAARTIPKTSRFRFGTADDWSIKTADPAATSVTVLAAGSSHTGAPDTYILAQTSASTWAVDIPLEGVLSSPIAAGASGTGTEISADLVGIAAATAFSSGLPPSSLPDLARMARRAAYSLTAGSRASSRTLVYRNWPESNMVSPIVPGDTEMQRLAAGSAMALQRPAVDLYVRSARDMQREVQHVRLAYVLPDGAAKKVFRGALPLLHRPSRILGIEWSGTTGESRVIDHTVFSQFTRADLYGGQHCGTRHEALFAEVDPEVDGLDVPLIPLSEDGGGQYAIFAVTYDADPLLESVASLVESPEYRPAGVDVLVKSGPLLLIDSLDVTYVKKEGVKTVLSAARSNIVEYARSSGYPDAFRFTELMDIMRAAGADRVRSFAVEGRILVSAASRLFRSSVADPGGDDIAADWSDGEGADEFSVIEVTTAEGVSSPNSIVDGEISAGGPAELWAATARTVRVAIDPGNINFIEGQ